MRTLLIATVLIGTAVLTLPASAAPITPSPGLTQAEGLTSEVRMRTMKRRSMRGHMMRRGGGIGSKKGL